MLYVSEPKGVDENVSVPGELTLICSKKVPVRKFAEPLYNNHSRELISPGFPATSVTATLAETNCAPTGTVNANESKSELVLVGDPVLPVTVFVPTSRAMIGKGPDPGRSPLTLSL